jgi:hypothetical protein
VGAVGQLPVGLILSDRFRGRASVEAEGAGSKISDPETVAAWPLGRRGLAGPVDDTGNALTADYGARRPDRHHGLCIALLYTERSPSLATIAPGGATRWQF